MKILVTGPDGFVGSYVTAWPEAIPLIEHGQRVDICDPTALTRAIQNIRLARAIRTR